MGVCEAHRRHGHVSPMNHDSRGSQIRKSTVTESTQGHQAGCGRTPETGENTRSLLILEMRKAEGHRCPSHREPCRRTAPRLGHPPHSLPRPSPQAASPPGRSEPCQRMGPTDSKFRAFRRIPRTLLIRRSAELTISLCEVSGREGFHHPCPYTIWKESHERLLISPGSGEGTRISRHSCPLPQPAGR